MADYNELLGLSPEAPEPPPLETGPEFDFGDAYELSRSLDSTTAAIDRMHAESLYKLDPNYQLASNHSELLKDVPEHYQGVLNEQLVNARSENHAWFIRNETLRELQANERLSQYGIGGMAVRMGAGLLDEGVLGLAVLGPVAAGYRAAAVARGIWAANTAKRAAAFAGVTAAENAALETLLAAGSQTRSPEDILYAAAFGALFGAAGGAIVRPGARLATGERAAADIEAPPVRREEFDGVDVSEPDVASQAQRHVEELDEAIMRDTRGEGPDPEHPVIQKHADETNSALAREVGLEPEEPVVRPIVEDVDLAAARQAAVEDSRMAAIDARIKEIAETDVPEPPRPTLVDEIAKAREVATRAKNRAELGPVERTRLDQELQQSKRHLMRVMQEQATDAWNKLGLSKNPKTDDYIKFLESKADSIAKKATKVYEKDRADWEKKLDKMDEELASLREEASSIQARKAEAEAQAKAKQATDEVASFGADTAGAAAVSNRARDLAAMTPEAQMELLENAPPMTFLAKMRFGGYAITNRSPNHVVRWLGHKLFSDAVGAKDGTVATPSALSRFQQLEERVIGRYAAEERVAFNKWLESRGVNAAHQWDIGLREEFNKLVSDAVEDVGDAAADPNVARAARAFNKAVGKVKAYAEAAGVTGFDEFAHSNTYLPHIHNSEAFRRAHTDMTLQGNPKRLEGWGAADEVIYQGMLRANPDMDQKVAQRFAKRYVNTVMRKDAGLQGQYMDLNRVMDLDNLQEIVKGIGLDPDDADHLYTMLYRDTARAAKDAGKTPRAKHRTLLDMDTVIRVTGDEGPMDLHITSLFQRNASKLMHSYVRSVGGLAAIADVTKGTPIHLNSRAKIDGWMTKAAEWEVDWGIAKERGALLNRDVLGEIETLKMGFNSLLGIPINDPSSGFTHAARRIKDYNFITLMGQTAWAQMSELGAVVAHLGWARTLKALPELRKAIRNPDSGDLQGLAQIAEEYLGVGTTALRGRNFAPHIEDIDAIEGRVNLTDSLLHKGKLIVGGPMHAVMVQQQRLLNIGMMQKWADVANGRHKLADWEVRRLGQAGMSQSDIDKVVSQYSRFGEYDAKGKLVDPHFEQWEDYDAFLKMRDAVHSITRRAVQENDMSNVPPMLSKSAWSMLFQFRNFIIGAWEKHFLNNVNNLVQSGGKDFEAWANFSYQTLFAGVAYYGMVHTKTIGMDEKRKRKYLKDHLGADRVGWNIIGRTGWSTVLPGVVDTARGFAGFDPLFGYSRGSGLAQNFVTGAPPIALANRITGAVQGAVASTVNPDYQFSSRNLTDWQYALPGATLFGVLNAWNALGNALDLPSRSQEQ